MCSCFSVTIWLVLLLHQNSPYMCIHTQCNFFFPLHENTLKILRRVKKNKREHTMRQVPVCVEAILQDRGTLPLTRAWSFCNCCSKDLQKETQDFKTVLLHVCESPSVFNNVRYSFHYSRSWWKHTVIHLILKDSVKTVSRSFFLFQNTSHCLKSTSLNLYSLSSFFFPHEHSVSRHIVRVIFTRVQMTSV